jgi:sec-independent protein translocase protein TatA
MGSFSFWHILILAIIVLLLFGGNRFSAMMGDVAKGLKSFKQGMSDEEEEKKKRFEEQRRLDNRPIDVSPEPRRAEEPVSRPGDDR